MTSPNLRIALISADTSPLAAVGDLQASGHARYIDQLTRSLAAAGHQVDVLTRRDDAHQAPAAALTAGARVLHLTAGPMQPMRQGSLMQFMPEFASAAAEVLGTARGYDVMHAHCALSGWVGLGLRQRCELPLVTSLHGAGLARREQVDGRDSCSPQRLSLERALVQKSDCVVAASPQEEADLLRLHGAAPDRVSKVAAGVDIRQLSPGVRQQARQRLGLPADDFILLHLGQIVARKGIDNVLRALAQLPAEPGDGAPTRLLVLSDAAAARSEPSTPERQRLQRLAAELGVAERVQFVGLAPGQPLRDWYVAADVLVSTPWFEPEGAVALEAMACAVPVVGSAVGGLQNAVQDGVTGFLVSPHQPAALAERLQRLRREPALGMMMGYAGMCRVRSQFTWPQVADRLARLYTRVSHRHGHERADAQVRALSRPADLAAAHAFSFARPQRTALRVLP